MPRAPIRVMIADDHALWRRGVRQIIDAQKDMAVVAEARSGEEAIQKAKATLPSVILMDVNMPEMDGVDATRAIIRELPETCILMLTVSDTDESLFESLKSGALGFLTKDINPHQLATSIRQAAEGRTSLSPLIATRIVKYVQQDRDRNHKTEAQLTRREDEILRMVAEGSRDREIADHLYISESTVKKHVQNVLRKLHVRNRMEAISLLERQGQDEG